MISFNGTCLILTVMSSFLTKLTFPHSDYFWTSLSLRATICTFPVFHAFHANVCLISTHLAFCYPLPSFFVSCLNQTDLLENVKFCHFHSSAHQCQPLLAHVHFPLNCDPTRVSRKSSILLSFASAGVSTQFAHQLIIIPTIHLWLKFEIY